jgi:hypothetical protein
LRKGEHEAAQKDILGIDLLGSISQIFKENKPGAAQIEAYFILEFLKR